MRKALALALCSGLALAACDSNSSNGNQQQTGINSLGSFFSLAFRQKRNAEPLPLDGQTLRSFPRREPFDV